MKRNHQLGQYFIRNPKLIAELLRYSDLGGQDVVYDLGAGSGVISGVISSSVGKVFAVENDRDALLLLRENMSSHANVDIIEGDILGIDLPTGDYKIFANPPFSLSSQILHKFLLSVNPPKTTYLICQKQFAEKLFVQTSKFTSQLGIELGPLFEVNVVKFLKQRDFSPEPRVDTVFLEIKLREAPLLEKHNYEEFVKFVKHYYMHSEKLHQLIGKQLRPATLTLKEWLKLFKRRTTDK